MLMPPVDAKRDTKNLYSETVESPPVQSGFSDQPQTPSEEQEAISLEDIDAMEPRQFEEWCLKRLQLAGYRVSRTPKSWDCGADGLAESENGDKSIIIQCKHTQTETSCGEDAVHEVLAARQAYDRPDADLHAVTNAKAFVPAARKLAAKEGVKLIARDELLGWPFP